MAEGNAHRETVLLWLAVQEAKHGHIHWPWLRWFAPAQAPQSSTERLHNSGPTLPNGACWARFR